MREDHTVFHRHTFERNKWKHVGRSQSRMLSAMASHVDQFRGQSNCIESCCNNVIRVGDKGYY